MVGFKGLLASVVAAVVVAAGVQSSLAAPVVTVLSDTGTLNTSFIAPPASNSSNAIATPYGSGSVSITPVLNPSSVIIGYKLTLNPSSGFAASANNLAGGKSQTFGGLLAFDITFDNAVRLTTNIYEDGIYSVSGLNSRVGVATQDSSSGVIVTERDTGTSQTVSSVFRTAATISPLPTGLGGSFPTSAVGNSGVWTLFDQATGFAANYRTYHVVLDNDLIAEALVNLPGNAPGFAAIAKKDFSIIFTFDGSSGQGPGVPEPASLGVLALGGLSLLARRRK